MAKCTAIVTVGLRFEDEAQLARIAGYVNEIRAALEDNPWQSEAADALDSLCEEITKALSITPTRDEGRGTNSE